MVKLICSGRQLLQHPVSLVVASLVQSVMDLSHVGNDSSVSGVMSQSFGLALLEMESLKFDEVESSLSSSSALLEEEDDAIKLLFPNSSRS